MVVVSSTVAVAIKSVKVVIRLYRCYRIADLICNGPYGSSGCSNGADGDSSLPGGIGSGHGDVADCDAADALLETAGKAVSVAKGILIPF